jgi:probable poly-beta-1,6-N-acetyl-D-glucosamine export protein
MTRRLLFLNGLAILAVIVFHSAGWGLVAMLNWTHRYLPVTVPNYDQIGTPAYYVLRTLEQIIEFAIPAFLFVSGYFVAVVAGRKKSVSWNTIGNRIRSLLIPYLFWSLLLFVLLYFEGRTYSISGYLRLIITGETNPAYYYVPLLIQFYLLAPFLVHVARNHSLLLLIITGLVQFAVQALYYPSLLDFDAGLMQPIVDIAPKWLFFHRIFWFASGIVAAFHVKEFERILARLKWGALATALTFIPLGILQWELMQSISAKEYLQHRETFLDSVYAMAVILSVLAFRITNQRIAKPVEQLATKSYGIYLAHPPVMEYFARTVYHLAPWLLAYQLLFVALVAVIGLGIPLACMAALKRSRFRGFYHYIFG